MLRHVPAAEIPATHDLFEPEDLETVVRTGNLSYSLVTVGDVMLGERSESLIEEHGATYPFRSVLPLLKTAPYVFGNLEGPLAPKEWKRARNHVYAMKQDRARGLVDAGLHVMTVANNHLMDCGPEGVLETLRVLESAGVAPVGVGTDERTAHRPIVRHVGSCRIGFLAYYWHRRCAAGASHPGAAVDSSDRLEADLRELRGKVDRIVVGFHWGIPYEREPLPQDRVKARFAIDCGADLVVGHHPHVVQPFEIHRGKPIFYSLGNFAFGTGNSRAEGLLLGIRFEDDDRILIDVFNLYLKNRDPRVNYQTKVMKGEAATRMLNRLARLSGPDGQMLSHELAWGRIRL
jgi:poly-gamma-glutamate capsule biosynthesis protein CapA/YwtB (metallophosphatase superfamily)